MFRLVLKKVNNSVQKEPINLPSLSLTILVGTPYNLTTCLKNN